MPEKSLGQTAGGVGGAIIGGTIGFFASAGNPAGAFYGASLGASLGGMVGGIVDPPNANLPNVQGPMEAQVNTFHRNLPVPIVYGVTKVSGNLIWMGKIRTEVRGTA